MSANKSDLVSRLKDFLLKQEDVKCFSEDEDWDSEVEPSMNPGNQSVLDEFIHVLKSQVDSDHEKIEHLNAEVEQLKLQFKMKAYESSELTEAVKDLNSRNERTTISQNICTECKDITLDMAKVKLELAMLWSTVNTKPMTSSKNASTQTVDLPTKQPTPQLPSEGQVLQCSSVTKSRTDFENQLNCYRLANKENFEIKKQVNAKRNSKWLENNELAKTKCKLREVEQERDSLGQLLKFLKTI